MGSARLETFDRRRYREIGGRVSTAAGVDLALGQRTVDVAADARAVGAVGGNVRQVFQKDAEVLLRLVVEVLAVGGILAPLQTSTYKTDAYFFIGGQNRFYNLL